MSQSSVIHTCFLFIQSPFFFRCNLVGKCFPLFYHISHSWTHMYCKSRSSSAHKRHQKIGESQCVAGNCEFICWGFTTFGTILVASSSCQVKCARLSQPDGIVASGASERRSIDILWIYIYIYYKYMCIYIYTRSTLPFHLGDNSPGLCNFFLHETKFRWSNVDLVDLTYLSSANCTVLQRCMQCRKCPHVCTFYVV